MRLRAAILLYSVAIAAAAPRVEPYTAVRGVRPSNAVLWRDPGRVERRDLRYGPGGAALRPRPPFTFLEEDRSGSTPKVAVRDAAGRRWVVKFGPEARSDTFASRLAWSLGYYAEINYFVPRGVIRAVGKLHRARDFIDQSGRFTAGRFQLRSASPRYLVGVSWSWEDNPFLGTPQLNGLKILMMLLSNWDDKDLRDARVRGTNNAVAKDGNRFLFFIDDWGAAMGRAGGFFSRSKWDAHDYYRQTPDFVRVKDDDGRLEWGYRGTHTARMTEDIRVSDIRWLLRYLGRLTDHQLREALLACGAARDEADLYAAALRLRVRRLQAASAR